MINKDVTSKDKYLEKHETMYNKIVDTWGYGTLTDMLSVFRSTRGLYFLFSKDLSHVWFIGDTTFIARYDYSYSDNKELLINLVKENNYNLEKVAKVLGIEPMSVFQAIHKPYSLNSILPMLELEDIVEERKLKWRTNFWKLPQLQLLVH